MNLLRLLLVATMAGACFGCQIGGPERASDIQNPNAISDDISAVTMTQSDRLRAHDPNLPTTLPTTYEVVREDAAGIPLP